MDPSPCVDLFLAEAREHVGAAYALAAAPAAAGEAGASTRDLLRHLHSVKGMAASMGYASMSALAHDAESVIAGFRERRTAPTPEARRLLCSSLACLERMLARAARGEGVEDLERAGLQGRLRRLVPAPSASTPGARAAHPGGGAAPRPVAPPAPAGLVAVRLVLEPDRPLPAVQAAIVLGKLARLGRILGVDPPAPALRAGRFGGRLAVTLATGEPILALGGAVAAIEEIARFTLAPAAPELAPTPGVAARRARASRLLVPFAAATGRLAGGVEALARALGKSVDLAAEGEHVLVDRPLLERLTPLLVHTLRNAVDHGIELPAERVAAGKPAAGRIRMRLEREAGRLVLRVEDDGRGLDLRLLRLRAIALGLLTPSQAVRLPDEEAAMLVALPGLSTAPRASEVSGRGLGMDVVRSTVEALGGRLRVVGAPGRGCCIEMAIPWGAGERAR